MHIPDGFISPVLYLPGYGVAAGIWGYSLYHIKEKMNERTLPYIGVMGAFSFVLMSFVFPLPWGSSAHATGIPLLTMLFGVRITFLITSLVLALQSLILGEGGITALPINALGMGLVGALAMRGFYLLFRPIHKKGALLLASYLSVVFQALATSVALGIQPLIASDTAGHPLFFPFGLEIVVPAVVVPHLWIGFGEAVLTLFILRMICSGKGKLSSFSVCSDLPVAKKGENEKKKKNSCRGEMP